ncbi:D-alanyl-D-alanine carboxypeptidase family protein [Anaerolentibacter hominis]|uniref:D-alanyl-D-alanine carboxypeptidase family protein n=1 Tax=Anaerolentibacter hominis TaxID=3079009 RepID=UPI0031B83C21
MKQWKRIRKRIVSIGMVCVLMLGNVCQLEPAHVLAEEAPKADTNAPASQPQMEITAVAAVLIEGSTGRVLYEKNKDEQLIPASITKIMTLLLIFEALESGKISLTDEVAVSEHAASMGGSQVYLEPFETQTVNDMIKCISIASANDAAVAMAEFIAGSEESFVAAMNEKAKELGMENTHFLNCCGLDDDITEGHYSSAYDVALMSRELITKHPQISDYSTVWMDSITHVTKKGESEFGLTNTNKLVRTYNGITGLKTGSTSKAKYCLSATAARDGIDMIAVIMAAPDHKVRFTEAAKLLDYGFANATPYADENALEGASPVKVKKALDETLPYAIEENFAYVCVGEEKPDQITKKITLPEELTAPIHKGDVIGAVEYFLNGVSIGKVNILAAEDRPEMTYGDCIVKMGTKFLVR